MNIIKSILEVILSNFLKILTNIKNKSISDASKDFNYLPQIRIHDFRHRYVSLLKNNGFTSFEIAKRVGITKIEINETCSHSFNETQQDTKNKLDQFIEQSEKSYLKVA